MCTLIFLNQIDPDYPCIIASNRDEFFNRPSRPPSFLTVQPPVFGGQDLEKGGTWLGLSTRGFACGLVNHRTHQHRRNARSRGEIVLNALKQNSSTTSRSYLDDLNLKNYNPFHILVADTSSAWVMNGIHSKRWTKLPIGVSVLTNGGLNDPNFPKVDRIRQALRPQTDNRSGIFQHLMDVLADQWMPNTFKHFSGSGLDSETERALHAVCVKTPAYGTRSASIIALSDSAPTRYFHAEGSPAEVPFVDLSDELTSTVS